MLKKLIISFLLLMLVGNALAMPLDLWWKYNARLGISSIFITDLEGDGKKEVLAGSYDGYAYLLDERGNLIWKYYTLCPTYAVYAADMRGDNKKEVLIGSCRALHLIDNSGEQIWRFSTKNQVKKIQVADLDSDGKKEIIFTTGSGNKHLLYVMDKEAKVKWRREFKGSPFQALQIEAGEVLFGASQLHILNSTGGEKWSYKTEGKIRDISLADLDNNGKKEILVGTHLFLEVLKKDGTLLWKHKFPEGINKIEVSDIDSDGDQEIIIASDNLSVLDKEGNLLWNYPEKANSVKADDLDGDGTKEIIAGSETLYLLDERGTLLWNYSPYRPITQLEIADLDGDEIKEIIVGALDHNVYAFKIRESYRKEKSAQLNYEKALSYYNLGNYANATILAKKAKSLYQETNNPEGVSQCSTLLSKITKKLEEKITTTSAMITPTTLEKEEIPAEGGNVLMPLLYLLGLFILIAVYYFTKGKKKRKS